MRELVNAGNRIESLINAAAKRFGSRNKLAQALGYHSSEVSEWALAKRPCPIEAQALMADAAGLDANEVIAYAIIERHANTPRGEKLLTALGKALPATSVGAFLSTFASVGSAFELAHSYFIRCILC